MLQIYSLSDCTGIPCRDSNCENGLVRCCLYREYGFCCGDVLRISWRPSFTSPTDFATAVALYFAIPGGKASSTASSNSDVALRFRIPGGRASPTSTVNSPEDSASPDSPWPCTLQSQGAGLHHRQAIQEALRVRILSWPCAFQSQEVELHQRQ